ncbi:MAG: hypothetical protein LBD25_01665 [Coriobacteriales bacterium]|nr:hypothetical protein [Coriobacteriales bacterium]
MNPVIIIPTYVGSSRKRPSYNVVATYDHVTPLNHQGELLRCLASLRTARIDIPIFVLVAAEPGIEHDAADKIHETAASFAQDLMITVIDDDVLAQFYTRADILGFGAIKEGVSLTGYSAIRNLGLIVAAAGGFTECIFIDDDEVVEDPAFLEKAVYGLGKLTQKGVPVLVKSGYFTDRKGNWKSTQKNHWYDRYWHQGDMFNAWITKAMGSTRLSRSNGFYGGLCAIHREAYRRISFDPWIPRGEDLDYLLNVRMYGGDVWFDNQWSISHLPPANRNESQRFRQDIYRWIYEHRKLEYAKSQIDLLPIQPHSLDPYPGPFLEHSVTRRVFLTALLRVLGRPRDRKGYFKAAMAAQREAKSYAEVFCSKYYEFQIGWPQVVATLENDGIIRNILAYEPTSDKDSYYAAASARAMSGPMGGFVGSTTGGLFDAQHESPAKEELLEFELDLGAMGIETPPTTPATTSVASAATTPATPRTTPGSTPLASATGDKGSFDPVAIYDTSFADDTSGFAPEAPGPLETAFSSAPVTTEDAGVSTPADVFAECLADTLGMPGAGVPDERAAATEPDERPDTLSFRYAQDEFSSIDDKPLPWRKDPPRTDDQKPWAVSAPPTYERVSAHLWNNEEE